MRELQIERRNRSLSFRENFSWALLGNVILAACNWAIIVVVAKLGSPEEVGLIVLGLAISGPVLQFFNMGLTTSQATDAKGQFEFADYFGLRIVSVLVGVCVIAGLILLSAYATVTATVVMLVALAKAAEGLSTVVWGFYQQRDRLDLRARSQIVKGVLSLCFLTLGMVVTRDIVWATAGMCLGYALTFITVDLAGARREIKWSISSAVREGLVREQRMTPNFNRRVLWELAVLSIPVGCVGALGAWIINLPRITIEQVLGTYELGIYGALAYSMVVLSMVMNAVDQSSKARLARSYANREAQQFVALVKKTVVIGIVIGVVAVLMSAAAGRTMIQIVYTEEYAQYATTLTILMVAALVGQVGASLNNAITAARRFKTALAISGIAGTVIVPAALWLIPKYGVIGGAWSLTIGYGAKAVLCAIMLHSMTNCLIKESMEGQGSDVVSRTA